MLYATFCNVFVNTKCSVYFDKCNVMEIHDRLRRARNDAGYLTAKDAADAFGWNEVTYRSHEAGDRGIKKIVAERYAKAFKVSFEWLFLGRGTADRESAEIIDIWDRIPVNSRDEAKRMLGSLAREGTED